MTITFELPSEVADRLTRKAAEQGQDVAFYIRQIAEREAEPDAEEHTLSPRTPGLHAGRYWIADDFDAPLPEAFWLGTDGP